MHRHQRTCGEALAETLSRDEELVQSDRLSDLDSSWDWGWYDPQLLEGFEKRIEEAYAPYRNLLPNFVELLVRMFVIQRSYVNEGAAAWEGCA